MKGVAIKRARPSNAVDIYKLLVEANEENIFRVEPPTKEQLQEYYFNTLILKEMHQPVHFYFLAQKGRGFMGMVHGIFTPSRWDRNFRTLFIDLVYVTKTKRKLGIGKALIDALLEDAEKLGIKTVDFLCDESQVEYWAKKRKAQKVATYMRFAP